jgi:hypothetical protein
VRGRPVGKVRPRYSRFTGPYYTPKPTRDWGGKVRVEFMSAVAELDICLAEVRKHAGRVLLQVGIYRAVATSWPRWKKDAALAGPCECRRLPAARTSPRRSRTP